MKPPVESLVLNDRQQKSIVSFPKEYSVNLSEEKTLNLPSQRLSGALDSQFNKDSTRKESTEQHGVGSSTSGDQGGNYSGKRDESGKKSYSRTLTNGLNERRFCMFSDERKAFGTATQ